MDPCTCKLPLYSMKPSLRSRFTKNYSRPGSTNHLGQVPWLTLRMAGFGLNCVPKLAIRAAIRGFIAAHPIASPVTSASKLYETKNARLLRQYFCEALDHGRAYYLYGAPGTQKTYVLQHLIAAKLIVAIGAGVFLLGLTLFLHSLGSGGGLFAASLMLVGAVSTVTAIVLAIVRALKRNHESSCG